MTVDNMKKENKNQHMHPLADAESEAAQAKEMVKLLDTHASHLSMRTLKQLENGRTQALKIHKAETERINRDGTISYLVGWTEHHRIVTSGMLLAAVIAGFIFMQMLNKDIEYGDAFLLGADLPPEAFVDTTFEPSLNRT